ncbi:MAG: hypothetical protein WAN47_11190 [Nitrosotalea sp.]
MIQLTEIESRIFTELSKIDTKISDIYYGAISVLDRETSFSIGIQESSLPQDSSSQQRPNPERLFHAAHSLRETLNVLLRRIEIPEQSDAFREKIKKFADPLGQLPDNLHGLFNELFDLHRWFTSVSHHGRYPTDGEFLDKFEKFNSTLVRILTPHFVSLGEMDKLIAIDNPTEEDMEKILPLMSKNYSSYGHFFTTANSNWITLLKNKGFFQNPPIPKREGNFIQFPSWPESYYLAKIAAEKPDIVYTTIRECKISSNKDEWNPRVLEDFVKAAIRMPCEYASKMSTLIVENKWQDTRTLSLLNTELSNLMEKLSDCGDIESSIELGSMLLDVDIVELSPRGSIENVE